MLKIQKTKSFGVEVTRQLSVFEEDHSESVLDMPLPLTEPPAVDSVCYAPCLTGDVIEFTWTDCPVDFDYLYLNIVHLSKEAAEEHKQFLLYLTK